MIARGLRVPEAIVIGDIVETNQIEGLRAHHTFSDFLSRCRSGAWHRVAIRSSVSKEDGKTTSNAGYFRSYIGNYTESEIVGLIDDVVKQAELTLDQLNINANIAVIVQVAINAKFGGVIFSSNPVNHAKNQIALSYGKGPVEQVVSGKSGQDIILEWPLANGASRRELQLEEPILTELASATKSIEFATSMPVDVEWCIEENTGDLYFLQCRPVASTLGIADFRCQKICTELKINQDKLGISSEKITLRYEAQEKQIHISDAYIISGQVSPSLDVETIRAQCSWNLNVAAVSVVLLRPSHVGGKIIRQFSNTTNAVEVAIAMLSEQQNNNWVPVVILQAIYKPYATGIARRIDNATIVEIGLGHFVPKGLVPVAQYRYDYVDSPIICLAAGTQTQKYLIIGESRSVNEVSKEELDHFSRRCPELVAVIAQSFAALLMDENASLEFGVIEVYGKSIPYLIDRVYENKHTNYSMTSIEKGIISPGSRQGILTFITVDPDARHASADIHLHDIQTTKISDDKNRIYFSEWPDIALLPLLQNSKPENIGFIFRTGTFLCHLALILRERGIPAIRANDLPSSWIDREIIIEAQDNMVAIKLVE